MSTLSQFSGGGVKSVQEGYVSSLYSGSIGVAGTRDFAYLDITISSVNPSKCLVIFDGGFGDGVSGARKPSSASYTTVTARLTSATTLRLSVTNLTTSATFCGQFQVIEFA